MPLCFEARREYHNFICTNGTFDDWNRTSSAKVSKRLEKEGLSALRMQGRRTNIQKMEGLEQLVLPEVKLSLLT
jgi:hypothetical protein